VAAFKSLGFVSEEDATVHLAKIGHPETDLLGLVELVQAGAVFYGNIDRTRDSGPALVAGHPGEFVIVPCNDEFQPVVALLEDGTMIEAGARAFWDVLARVKTILRSERLPVAPLVTARSSDRPKHQWSSLRRLLDRR